MKPDVIPCTSVAAATLFTIGYEGRTFEEYSGILLGEGIRAVVDVRKNAISRKKGFSKTALSCGLLEKGIAYFHIPGLGIDSAYRQNLETTEDYTSLFKLYRSSILPKAKTALTELEDILHRFSTVALTCFERDPEYCHRHCISDFIYSQRTIQKPAFHI